MGIWDVDDHDHDSGNDHYNDADRDQGHVLGHDHGIHHEYDHADDLGGCTIVNPRPTQVNPSA